MIIFRLAIFIQLLTSIVSLEENSCFVWDLYAALMQASGPFTWMLS